MTKVLKEQSKCTLQSRESFFRLWQGTHWLCESHPGWKLDAETEMMWSKGIMRARGGAGQTGGALSQSSGEEGILCTGTPQRWEGKRWYGEEEGSKATSQEAWDMSLEPFLLFFCFSYESTGCWENPGSKVTQSKMWDKFFRRLSTKWIVWVQRS